MSTTVVALQALNLILMIVVIVLIIWQTRGS